MHHAYVLIGEREAGIAWVREWAKRELMMDAHQNPDFTVNEYIVLSAEEAREVAEGASQAPFQGESKVVVLATTRIYNEAQNALLKVFEEPPPNTYLFLIVPTRGGLIATLLSRVHVVLLDSREVQAPEEVVAFLGSAREKRSQMIKKMLQSGDDDADQNREELIRFVSGVEAVLYKQFDLDKPDPRVRQALDDISALRSVLYERGGPAKLVLEHIALSVPENLRYHTPV